MRRFLPLLLLAVLVLPGCAANPGDGSERPGRGGRHLILEEEIRASHATNLLLLIRQARPHWFSRDTRFSSDANPVAVVYVDNMRFGLEGALEQIDPDAVTRIQFLDGSDATFRFGRDHGSGAILVTTAGKS